jgi:hypothetical protein
MAGFNDIRDRAKSIWMKGMSSIGNTAANIASNTRLKLDEMNLQNRRRELAQDLSGRVYSLWQKGEAFPPEIERILQELQDVDEKLNDMRAARYAQAGEADTEAEDAPAAEPDTDGGKTEETADPDDERLTDIEAHVQHALEDTSSALTQEINSHFDQEEIKNKAARVNSSLNELSEQMQRFEQQDGDAGQDGDAE